MVALDHGLRHHGLPMLTLWGALSGADTTLMVHEDNQAMIRVVATGRNPTMRYLGRTHRISVAWLHERFLQKDATLVYEVTTKMCADIYTKAFSDPNKWEAACWLISVVDPAVLSKLVAMGDGPPPQAGGGLKNFQARGWHQQY